MKKFNITVKGNTYAVEVEEVSVEQVTYTPKQQQSARQQLAQSEAAPQATKILQQVPSTRPVVSETEPASEGEAVVPAPMPGTILEIMVSEGQKVSKGDTLLILEAMKMENEIIAPADGVVKKIYIHKSTTINAGDPMLIIV